MTHSTRRCRNAVPGLRRKTRGIARQGRAARPESLRSALVCRREHWARAPDGQAESSPAEEPAAPVAMFPVAEMAAAPAAAARRPARPKATPTYPRLYAARILPPRFAWEPNRDLRRL